MLRLRCTHASQCQHALPMAVQDFACSTIPLPVTPSQNCPGMQKSPPKPLTFITEATALRSSLSQPLYYCGKDAPTTMQYNYPATWVSARCDMYSIIHCDAYASRCRIVPTSGSTPAAAPAATTMASYGPCCCSSWARDCTCCSLREASDPLPSCVNTLSQLCHRCLQTTIVCHTI